jgi:hypothetical protein
LRQSSLRLKRVEGISLTPREIIVKNIECQCGIAVEPEMNETAYDIFCNSEFQQQNLSLYMDPDKIYQAAENRWPSKLDVE